MNDIRVGVFRGQTVTLRPLVSTDAGAIAAAASESRLEFTYTRVPDGVDEAQQYIEALLADREAGRRVPFAIVWHDRVVGSTRDW
jgi:N-acetyltransferase